MLSAAALIAVLVAAVCLTHYFYNKHAEMHWAEVQERWEREVGVTDLDVLFPKIQDDLDLYKDPFFLEYLRRDNQVLGEIGSMDLPHPDGGMIANSSGVDFMMWFPEGEVETEVDAAKLVLESLKTFEDDAEKLQLIIRTKQISSAYNPGLSVDILQSPDWHRIELMSVQRFFADRAYARKLAGDAIGGSEDLNTVMRILDIIGNEPNFYNLSVKGGCMFKVSSLLRMGLEKDLWKSEDIEVFRLVFTGLDFQKKSKDIPLGERVHRMQVIALYDKYGRENAERFLMGEDAQYFEDQNALFDWDDNDWDDKVNWDLVIGWLMSPLVPEGLENESFALNDEFDLDVTIPLFQKDLSLETYREFKNSTPENPWYVEIAEPIYEVYVMYYGSLLHLKMHQKLVLISLKLEDGYLECGAYPENLNDFTELDLADVFNDLPITYTRHSDHSHEISSVGMSDEDALEWTRSSHGTEDKRLTFKIDKLSQKN